MSNKFEKEFLKGGCDRGGGNRPLAKVSILRNQEETGFLGFEDRPHSKGTVVCLYSIVHIFLVNICIRKDFLKGGGHRGGRNQPSRKIRRSRFSGF